MTWTHTSPTSPESAEAFDKSLFDLRALGSETRVDTDFGRIPARLLTDQHRLRVLSGGFRTIDWVEQLNLDADFLRRYPDLRPLCLPAGMFRADVPRRDILLTPNTMICASDAIPIVGRFGAAHQFTPRDGVSGTELGSITYVVIGCARPAMLRAEGMWVSC